MYFIETLIDISFYVFLGMLALKIFIVLVIQFSSSIAVKNPHIDIVISIAKALEVTIDEIVIKDLSKSKEG